MSYPLTQLGSGAFNHNQSSNAEAEYDRLRSLARQEIAKKSSLLDRAHNAYERGDGAAAHELSEEGKRHGQAADAYNKQASDFIFRENNAVGRVAGDTIDLHGQFVEEAEDILEQRIRYAQSQGQTHLHVIVGKGNHSAGHIQRIKPRVEQICQQLGLQYATEHNAGRIYINLTGGPAQMPQQYTYEQGGGYAQGYGGGQSQHHEYQHGNHQGQQHQPYQQGYNQEQYGTQQQQQQQQQQPPNNHNAEIEAAVKILPKILKKLGCCTIM